MMHMHVRLHVYCMCGYNGSLVHGKTFHHLYYEADAVVLKDLAFVLLCGQKDVFA